MFIVTEYAALSICQIKENMDPELSFMFFLNLGTYSGKIIDKLQVKKANGVGKISWIFFIGQDCSPEPSDRPDKSACSDKYLSL